MYNTSIDETMRDMIEAKHYNILEEAVDEYLCAEATMLYEMNNAESHFLDLYIDPNQEEIDSLLDEEIDDNDTLYDDTLDGEFDDSISLSDPINSSYDDIEDFLDVNINVDIEDDFK